MGYYTSYGLEVIGIENKEAGEKLAKRIEKMSLPYETFDPDYSLAKTADGDYCLEYWPREPQKWYDSEEDMTALSREFPNYVFKLHGEGEDFMDMWDQYFADGMSELCTVVYEFPKPLTIKWKGAKYPIPPEH